MSHRDTENREHINSEERTNTPREEQWGWGSWAEKEKKPDKESHKKFIQKKKKSYIACMHIYIHTHTSGQIFST